MFKEILQTKRELVKRGGVKENKIEKNLGTFG